MTSWTYDGYGRIQRQTLANGTKTDYGYDALDRVSSIVHRTSANAVLSSESYVYNAGGNLDNKTVDGVTTTYTYDAIDQLESETRPGYACSYTYDPNGNRQTKTLNGVVENYNYDDADKLLSRTSTAGTFTYGYDVAGRTTSVTKTGYGTTLLTYDFEDRVKTITGPGGLSTTYAYNALDTRVSKGGTGGARTYKRDGAGVTAPVLSDGVGTMVPGISERTGGNTKFSHLDRLGTNAKTTDSLNNVVDSRTYDAFGVPISITNPTNSQKGFASAFGYQEDSETGLKLLGHRYYDSATGRFLTRDPIGDGRNWYVYCGNNPITTADPAGLSPMDSVGAAVTGFFDKNGKRRKKTRGKEESSDASGDIAGAGTAITIGIFGISLSAGAEGAAAGGASFVPPNPPGTADTRRKFRKRMGKTTPGGPPPLHDAHHVITINM